MVVRNLSDRDRQFRVAEEEPDVEGLAETHKFLMTLRVLNRLEEFMFPRVVLPRFQLVKFIREPASRRPLACGFVGKGRLATKNNLSGNWSCLPEFRPGRDHNPGSGTSGKPTRSAQTNTLDDRYFTIPDV